MHLHHNDGRPASGLPIRGHTKLTFHYVAAMARADARRPLLLARRDDGTLALLDGRHRAARSLQLGYARTMAWILAPAQAQGFLHAPARRAEPPMSSVCS